MGTNSVLVGLVAAGAAMLVGMLWHSKYMFLDLWMKLNGFKEQKMTPAVKQAMQMSMIGGFISEFAMASVLVMVFTVFEITSLAKTLEISFWLWFGFIVPMALAPVLWEKKPLPLFYIAAGYRLVSVMVMTLVIFLF